MNNVTQQSKILLVLLLSLILILVGCKEPEEEVQTPAASADLLLMVTAGSGQTTTTIATDDASSDTTTTTNDTTNISPVGVDGPSNAYLGKATDIDQVMVTVTVGQVNLIVSQPLVLALNSYSGTLLALPIGPEITINVKGITAMGQEIYSGSQIVTLTGTETNLALNLNPIDDGMANKLPVVSSITTPTEITRATTGDVTIAILGAVGDSYECVFSPDLNGGFYTPASVWITLGSTTGTCASTFTAPDVRGAVSHEVAVTNDQNSTTIIGYDLALVSVKKNVGVTVGIAPTIDSLTAKVTKKGVTLTANVSDDQALNQLCYSWSYNGSAAAFKDATKNPATFSGYDPAVGGQITLTVRDQNCTGLSTTTSFDVAVGQWPAL